MKKIIFFFLFCMFQQAFSETIQLDLQSAINIAYEKNAELKRQKIILDAAARNFKNSGNVFIPSATLSLGESFVTSGKQKENSFNLEGGISLNLKSNFLLHANKNKINYDIEKINFDIKKNSLRQTISDLYFEILELQKQIYLTTENIKNLNELFEENQKKYDKGFLSELEYLNAKILYEKSKSELIVLQLEFENKKNNFKSTLGFPISDEIVFVSDLTQLFLDYSNYFTKHIQNDFINSIEIPDIKLLNLQKIAAEKDLQIKKLEKWGPDLNFSYQITPNFGNENLHGKVNNTFNIGILFPLDNFIPISQGYEEINLVKDQISDINIQICSQKEEVEISLTNLFLLINQKMKTIEVYKNLVTVTNNNFNLCKESYSKGIIDFQSLKNANSEYLQAQLEYSNLQLDILKTFSTIERISGKKICEE